MNEPVSSSSLLTLTAPPVKTPRAAKEGFSEQLNSLAKKAENRSPSPEESAVKTEASATTKEVKPEAVETESDQKTTSSDENIASTDHEEIASIRSEATIDSAENEETADDTIVAAPVAVPLLPEEAVTSEELLPAKTAEEVVALSDEAPQDSPDKSAEELLGITLEAEDVSLKQEETSLVADKQAVLETTLHETSETPVGAVAKENDEQQPIISSPEENNVNNETLLTAAEIAANTPVTSGVQNEEPLPKPSLTDKAKAIAAKGNVAEQSEIDAPVEKIFEKPSTPAPLSTAALGVSGEMPSLPSEDTPDTSDGSERGPLSVTGQEERANQRAELTAAAKTRTNSAPTIDPSRFVSRVAKAFEAAQQQGGGPIRMRLSPPELGMLQVQIEVKEGVLTASLEAETHAARNLLLENLPALRDRLAEQKISIEKFDVDVRDEQSGSDYDQENGPRSDDDAQSDRQPSRQSLGTTGRDSSRHDLETSAITPSTISFDDARVDLVA